MRDLDLNEDAFDAESMRGGSLFEYFEVLKRRWVVVLTVLLVVTVFGILFAKNQRRLYASSASLAVSANSHHGASGAGSQMDILNNIDLLAGGSHNVETQAMILSSPDTLAQAFSKLTPADRLDGFGVDQTAPQQVPQWGFDLEQKKNVDVITVNVTSYKPKLAALLANKIVETYLENDLSRNQEQARRGGRFVKTEMDGVKEQLRDASKQLALYAKETGIIEPVIQLSAATKDLVEAQDELDKTRVAAKAEQAQVDTLSDQIKKLSPEIDFAHTIETNPDYEQVRTRISNLEGQIATLRQTFTTESPELQSLLKALDAEKKNLSRFSKDYIFSRTVSRNPALDRVVELYAQSLGQKVVDEAKLKGIQAFVDRRQAEFKAIPEKGRRYAELKEEVDKLLKTYDLLSARYYELLIEEKSSIPSGFYVSKGSVPLKASFPNMVTAAGLSLLLGILGGIIAAMILERLDTRIHDPALVERITGLTVLTAVPEVKKSQEAGAPSLTIGSSDAPSGFAESFRLLRNNIAFSVPDTDLKIIAVTSAGKGDGKSTTSVNLAIAIAMDGNRVLLIDADLRRPALHKYLSLSREVGFTNVVRGNVTLEEAILPTAFDNVSCLATGPLPPSPSEFLNSAQARALFERAVELYDFVLVDCPPCTGLSDIQVISKLVQGIVLVVALDVTEKQYLAGAIRLLNLAGAPVLGMVLNRVRYSRSNYYYYSYYYYYGYYGEDEEDEKKRKKGPRPPKNA